MSIQEKIDAAWKELFDGVKTNGHVKNGFRHGYMTALRGLWRDSDFDECQDGDWFYVLTDRGWVEAMKIGDGFDVITATGDCEFSCCREDVKRIVFADLPSPSEVFGEEVG